MNGNFYLFAPVLFMGAAMIMPVGKSMAQVKIGSNPTTISPNTNLEVEATDGKKTVV
jgi:hypothetical protein